MLRDLVAVEIYRPLIADPENCASSAAEGKVMKKGAGEQRERLNEVHPMRLKMSDKSFAVLLRSQ